MDKEMAVNMTEVIEAALSTTTEGYDDTGAVMYMVVIILMFAFGIMLMIGAQVARGESAPGLNKYMKQMNTIKESAFFDRNRRILESRKRPTITEEPTEADKEKRLGSIEEIDLTESSVFMHV